jgi:hypothetical protein
MTKQNSEKTYTWEEICELLEKASALGFSLEKGSELEKLTVDQLDSLVNQRQ